MRKYKWKSLVVSDTEGLADLLNDLEADGFEIFKLEWQGWISESIGLRAKGTSNQPISRTPEARWHVVARGL